MKPHPCRRYRPPRYPGKHEARLNPRLLAEHLPPAWKTGRELAGAATIFITLGLSNCHRYESASGPDRAVVAPIFQHGEGRGSVGGYGPMPRFLSEEEGMRIISEELTTVGINLSQKNIDMPKAIIHPFRQSRVCWPGQRSAVWSTDPKIIVCEEPEDGKPLNADAIDPARNIAIEFVSKDDYFELGGPFSRSSVQYYNFIKVAENVGERVKEGGEEIHWGTFYEPMWDNNSTDPKPSQQLLRLQVKDFIEWLKAQGAI